MVRSLTGRYQGIHFQARIATAPAHPRVRYAVTSAEESGIAARGVQGTATWWCRTAILLAGNYCFAEWARWGPGISSGKAIAGKPDAGLSFICKAPFGNALVPGGIAVAGDRDERVLFEHAAYQWCLGMAMFQQ